MQIQFMNNKSFLVQILIGIGLLVAVAVFIVVFLPFILLLLLLYPFVAQTRLAWNLRSKMKNPFSGTDGDKTRMATRSFDDGDPIDVDATVVSSEETGGGSQQGDN